MVVGTVGTPNLFKFFKLENLFFKNVKGILSLRLFQLSNVFLFLFFPQHAYSIYNLYVRNYIIPNLEQGVQTQHTALSICFISQRLLTANCLVLLFIKSSFPINYQFQIQYHAVQKLKVCNIQSNIQDSCPSVDTLSKVRTFTCQAKILIFAREK